MDSLMIIKVLEVNKSNSKSNNNKCLSKNNNSNINENAQSDQIIF